jgi:prepilin-type processing-associated H-X9-DG protein
MDTTAHADGTKPWRFATPKPPPNIPANTPGNLQDEMILQAGFQQGPLYQYAPNVSVLHCPADQRANSPYSPGTSTPPGCFAWGSYSGSGAMNGTPYSPNTPTTKQSGIAHPSQRYLWVEENDPRGENQGSWVMKVGGTPSSYSDAVCEDSISIWHGSSSTFSWADGHSEIHRWQDAGIISFAASMDPNKYFGAQKEPTFTANPHDVYFLALGYCTQQNP